MFTWMRKEFSASNSMHIAPSNTANKMPAWKPPEASRSTLLFLATPSSPCPNFCLMLSPPKFKGEEKKLEVYTGTWC